MFRTPVNDSLMNILVAEIEIEIEIEMVDGLRVEKKKSKDLKYYR